MRTYTRRVFLYLCGIGVFLSFHWASTFKGFAKTNVKSGKYEEDKDALPSNIGVGNSGKSKVVITSGSSPEQNTQKAISMLGGIESFIAPDDIIILKPNAQWWNQGMTNTDSMKAFIESVLNMPGFTGEIIVAENHHYLPENSRGWITDKRNGRFNYNELIAYFQKNGWPNVTGYRWRDGGKNPNPLEGDDGNNGVVKGPEDRKDGYVWREDLVFYAPNGHKCMMNYPVFTSSYSGRKIDLKNGAWKNGQYLKNKVKLINFSALNHHSSYSGVTASVKNLMGITDMTCGYQGGKPKDFFNTHFVGVNPLIKFRTIAKAHWRIHHYMYKNFHYSGGALGFFIKNIKAPDLNIITADWIGWGSRTATSKSVKAKTILASKDPVALDYIAAKDVLLPATPVSEHNYRKLNDPTLPANPFRKFLEMCHKEGVGNLSDEMINIEMYSSKLTSMT